MEEEKESKFTGAEFHKLSNPQKSHSTPLAIIAHIDINAFFAQVEQIRLGLTRNDPVVCVQWSSLIAVSYAARKYGINRMDNLETAKLKCPNLIAAHTAVFKKNESFWTYTDYKPSPFNHKVSLDPYRRESRKIMRVFKNYCDEVEKASVDECFLNLGPLVYNQAIKEFPYLKDVKNDDDEYLPPIPKINEIKDKPWFNAKGSVVIGNTDEILNLKEDKDSTKTRHCENYSIYDWDDIFIFMGALIVYKIRQDVESSLGYTTSAGISKTKTISKLACGENKPDNQTIVRSSSINNFLQIYNFTDFWSMGGKTGEIIQKKLNIPINIGENSSKNINDILKFNLKDLQSLLGDKLLGTKLYNLIRGQEYSELKTRLDIKSMISVKRFRGNSVNCFEEAIKWIRVFAADLFQRIVELDEELGEPRRPRTVSVHHKGLSKKGISRQCALPVVDIKNLQETIYECGCKLLKQMEENWSSSENMYPITNGSLHISNFETINSNNKFQSIDSFIKVTTINQEEVAKSRTTKIQEENDPQVNSSLYVSDAELECSKCSKLFKTQDELAEHADWHIAFDLSQEINGTSIIETQYIPRQSQKYKHKTSSPGHGHGPISERHNGKKKQKLDKGQMTLNMFKKQ